MSTPDFEKQQPSEQPAPPQYQQPDHQQPQYQQPQYQQQPYQQQPYQPPLPQGPVAGPGGQPPLRPDEEKTWGILAHAGGFLLGFLAPLIVWLIYRDRSQWIATTGREALNFQISYFVYFLVATFSIFLLVGFVLLPVIWIAYYVFMIIGSIKAAGFENYRYPLIFRLVS